MQHGATSSDQVAKTVFWIIMLAAAGFITGVLALIR